MKRLFLAAALAAAAPLGARPAAPAQPERSPRPLLVLIDVGHGGVDKGATVSQGTEKQASLQLALKLKAELEHRHVSVVLSRSSDKFLSLQDRVQLAQKLRPDCLLSLHAEDKTRFPRLPALQVTYFHPSGKSLAESLSVALKDQPSVGERPRIRVERQRFYIVRQSPVPSALVSADLSAMLDESGQQKLALGLANGVERFGRGLKR